jgi:simple sugar transport system substrate-binding protein
MRNNYKNYSLLLFLFFAGIILFSGSSKKAISGEPVSLKGNETVFLYEKIIPAGQYDPLLYHQTKEKEKLDFVFIAPCVNEAFFDPVKKGMNDAANLMQVNCRFTGTEEVNLNEQVNLVKQALDEGVDGVALSIIDPVTFDDVVKMSMDKGIPVVAFNVDDNQTPNSRVSAVVQDFPKAGKTVGNYMRKYIPENSKVLVLLHSAGITALDERLKGIQEALKGKNITWEILVTGIDPEHSGELICNKLKLHPEIKYILGTGQVDTESAGLIVEEYFKGQGYQVAGFDLSLEILRLIQEGIIQLTIDQQPYIQGFYPVIQLTLLCRIGLTPSNIDAGIGLITKENVKSVIRLNKEGLR